MKYLILTLFTLFSSQALFSADSKEAETALNQTLLDNAAKAKQIADEAAANSKPTSIKILSNKASSTTKTSSGNLTDQEKQLSENYVDQAGANKIIKEKCQGEMAQACSGVEVDHKTFGMSPALVSALAKAYATFGSMSENFLPLSKPEVKTADGKVSTEKAEKPTDYCKYIPAATEAISVFSQKNTVDNLNAGGETSQKESLLKAAKSHEGRAEQAQIQAVGWFGGAACYAANAALGNFATDTSLIVKLGAATLLGTFYQSEVSTNKGYAQKTKDIANSLPSRGDCNPVTENNCYCAEPEHENDPTYCKEQIAKKAASSAFTRVACTDNKMQIDPTCACDKNNTCFEKFLENQGAAELQIGMGYSNSPFKSIASIAHGRLEGGTLTSDSYARTSAIAKKALNDLSSKIPSNDSLTLSQKSLADAIMSKGIPASVARLMAQNSPSQAAIDKSMAKINGAGSFQLASNSPIRNNILDFGGGNGLGISGKKGDKKGSLADELLGKINPKSGNPTNAKIIEFAAKAQARAAQITKSDKPIFEIISLRYQTSGRRLLGQDK